MEKSTDYETGEQFPANIHDHGCSNKVEIDLETGEIDSTGNDPLATGGMQLIKPKFSIPKMYLQKKDVKPKCELEDQVCTLSKKEDVINLKEEILFGYNKTSYRLFLLVCGLFVCTPLAAVLLIIMEIIVHKWSHNKNNSNQDPSVYYRSPLHIYTSQFCRVCRYESDMDKVYELQEKRLKTCPLSLKNVARTIY